MTKLAFVLFALSVVLNGHTIYKLSTANYSPCNKPVEVQRDATRYYETMPQIDSVERRKMFI
jgi:hypothetical protein